MKLSSVLPVLTTLASVVTPVTSTSNPVIPSTYYYFHTAVQPSQPAEKSKYNGLYLSSYHTGAGLSDATFNPTPLPAHRGWFNGTSLNWFETKDGSYGSYFGVQLPYWNDYGAWFPVQINGGDGEAVFVLDGGNKLGVVGSWWFGGWLVCDWSHGQPQLFALALDSIARNATLPSSCAKVDLIAEVAPPRASSTTT